MATVHLLIRGKVQGVFYRATAKVKAKELGLNGWVKNTVDGNVEATISGDDADVQQFIRWCRQGPPAAMVEDVIVTPKPDEGLVGFEIIK